MRIFYLVLESPVIGKLEREGWERLVEWGAEARGLLPPGVSLGFLLKYHTVGRSRGDCRGLCMLVDEGFPVFIDNGAFAWLSGGEGLRLDTYNLERWLWDYARWLGSCEGCYSVYALPDVPVHGPGFNPEPVRAERIRLTARLHSRMLELLPERLRCRGVPVLQGFEVWEYGYSYWLHLAAGVLDESAYSCRGPYRGVPAVGSVVARKPTSAGDTAVIAEGRAAGTLQEFLGDFLEDCCRWIPGFHFFGIGSHAGPYLSHPRFYSSDTGAFGLNVRFKFRTLLGCRAPDLDCTLYAMTRLLRTLRRHQRRLSLAGL